MKRLLILNGSLHGQHGNTGSFLQKFIAQLPPDIKTDYLDLASCTDITEYTERFARADGFVFASGTYWQSWSSHAQRFFEQATPWEGTPIFLGKPVCIFITMHSVGGSDILSRAQNTFNLLGCVIPPMCCIVHSYMSQIAAAHIHDNDIWDESSMPTVAHNLAAAMNAQRPEYQAWDVSPSEKVHEVWIK